MKTFLRLLILFVLPLRLFAASNLTTPGTVTLMSTFECISVRAAFTGDDNSNNVAFYQYRLSGDTAWKDAYTPIIDRRNSVDIVGNASTNTANINQSRGSIVGLVANTAYDVKVTWTDTDGITGSASSTNTVSTLTYFPPTGGGTKYVDASAVSEGTGTLASPFKTITNAITMSSAGDLILVSPGDYAALTITKAGNAGNYFVLRTNGTPAARIGSSSANFALSVTANYWMVDGFALPQSLFSGVNIGANQHHIYIQNTLQTNAFARTNGGNYGGCALIGSGCNNIYILTNNWSTYNLLITNNADGEINNIDITGGGPDNTIIISRNILNGGWDAIGNRANSGFNGHCENSDFTYNSCTNWMDDLVELDGLGPNIRFGGNTARRWVIGLNNSGAAYAGSLLSDCGTYIGPSYVYRNDITGVYTNAAGLDAGPGIGVKISTHSSSGWVFYFHNTLRTASVSGSHELIHEGGGPGCSFRTLNHVFMDNIFVSRGNIYYLGGQTNIHNYNDCFKVGTADFATDWNCTSTDYASFAAFQAGTGQEANGIGTDPLLLDTLRIPTNSPAIDIGLVLTNFNDASSAWPFAGSGPDLGAFENATNAVAVTNATLSVTSSNPSSGVAITVSLTDLDGSSNGTTSFTRRYTTNVVTTLTAAATVSDGGVTKNFSKWQLDGIDAGFFVNMNFTMDTNHIANAVYLTPPPANVVDQNRTRKSMGTTVRR